MMQRIVAIENTHEYADSISMYSLPSGSHTLQTEMSPQLAGTHIAARSTHLAPFADSNTTGSGW